jgi:hypothetical protein
MKRLVCIVVILVLGLSLLLTSVVSANGTFDFSGFMQPVSDYPTVNTAKAGQVIPVKFGLNGDQGLNIFEGGPWSSPTNCATGQPLDGPDETFTAGSSGLSYDPLADTYNYSWKTDKKWAGTCRQLEVKLADGNSYYANFKFTR